MPLHLPKPLLVLLLDLSEILDELIGLKLVFFEGQLASDFLQDLVCTCKGKYVCSKERVCFEQKLLCTDLCPCQASEMCRNISTGLVTVD